MSSEGIIFKKLSWALMIMKKSEKRQEINLYLRCDSVISFISS